MNNLPEHAHVKSAAARGNQEIHAKNASPRRAKQHRPTPAESELHYESNRRQTTNVQSGDTQGLSDVADADSESVTELLEEGQTFEAEAILGVENAPDADVAEVTTRELLEDDVPPEYLDRD